jgi:hypothetical protein
MLDVSLAVLDATVEPHHAHGLSVLLEIYAHAQISRSSATDKPFASCFECGILWRTRGVDKNLF